MANPSVAGIDESEIVDVELKVEAILADGADVSAITPVVDDAVVVGGTGALHPTVNNAPIAPVSSKLALPELLFERPLTD